MTLLAHRLATAAALALAAAIAACAPPTQHWSPSEAPKANKVDWVQFNHAVVFPTGATALPASEREMLDRFMMESAVAYGDQVRISASGAAQTPAQQTQAERREAAIIDYFRSRNVIATRGPRPRDGSPADATVTVAVGRYVVTPPKCPDWSKPSGFDPENTTGSNYGCATQTNLGLMLADPGDLLRGRELGPADGRFAQGAQERYQTNAPSKFLLPGSTSTMGAVQ
ncbi:MAG: CpaD family pilus assembly lipoprotein [Rhodospirillales bacterium]